MAGTKKTDGIDWLGYGFIAIPVMAIVIFLLIPPHLPSSGRSFTSVPKAA